MKCIKCGRDINSSDTNKVCVICMNTTTDINDYRPHTYSEVMCVKCLSRWIAVRPTGTMLKELECTNCGRGYVIETGEHHE